MHDVIIIGGGPAGCTAALYTARADLDTLVVDMAASAGALGKAAQIANYPGVEGTISGLDLLKTMRQQAESFGAKFHKARVIGTELNSDPKSVFLSEGEPLQARTLILATGAMGRHSYLPGEQELVGRGVSYCATCDAAFFKDKTVTVYGDNDFAAEEAHFLTRFAKTVHWITPKQNDDYDFPANVVKHYKAKVKSVEGADHVTAVVFNEDKKESVLPTDAAFIYVAGNQPVVDYLFGEAGTDNSKCLSVDKDLRTNIPGVFAAGDMTCDAVQQVIVAAGQGCIAALAADKYLRGRKKIKKDYA
jgi:thioredoxin reductase (NADPH)